MTAWTFRPFGQHRLDLDVDFGQASQPHVVTDLLCSCVTSEASYEEVWRLPVGHRTALVLQIGLSSGIDTLNVLKTCRNGACGERLEIALSAGTLAESQDATVAAQTRLASVVGGHELMLRRPTGADQLAWQRQSYRSRREAVEAIIGSLIIGPGSSEDSTGAISDDEIDILGETLQEADPLVGLTVEVTCPGCAESQSFLVDVQQAVLARLQQRQQRLFREVHEIAWHYHWPEDRILALSSQRRRQYLNLIERQQNL